MIPSSYYLYTAFYCYFWIANVKQILVYFVKRSLISNGSLFKWILLLLLLTLTLLSALRHVVVVSIVARCLGGGVTICIVVRGLRCCPSSALHCIVVSPCHLWRGMSLLSALSAFVQEGALSCALSSVVCIVVPHLHCCPLSAPHWGFCITSSSATWLCRLQLHCHLPCH
jgi:hypothetical protein